MMNNGTADATFTFDFNVSARTPVDWTASILGDKTSVVVPAGMSKDVTLQLMPGSTLGIGDVSATVTAKSGTTTNTFTSDVLTVVSENITTLHILDGEDANSLSPIILAAKGKTSYPEVNSNLFAGISSQLKGLKTIVWDCSATGEIGAAEAKSIGSAMDNGVGVLLCGGATTQGLVTEGIISKFGAGFVAFCREGYGSAPYAIKLSGVAGDPISGSFGTNVTGNLINYLLPLYKVTSPNATPILAFTKSADSICGVRIDLPNSRAVLLGMNPFVVLDKTKRETLIKNAINWIEGVTDVAEIPEGSSDLLTVSASPNPSADMTTISYSVRGNTPQLVSLNIVDALGREVMSIGSKTLSAGEYSSQVNAGKLSAGAYRVIVRTATSAVQTPLVIVR